MQNNKKTIKIRWGVFAVSITLSVVYLFSLSYDSKVLYPFSNLNDIYIDTYREEFSEKSSVTSHKIFSDSLLFNYTLSSFFNPPYAGIYLRKKIKEESLVKTNDYTHINIQFKTKKGKRHPLILKYDNYKKIPNTDIEDIIFSKILKTEPNTFYDLKIPLSDFEIPSWWFREKDANQTTEKIEDYNNLKYIIFESCEAFHSNEEDSVTIYYLEFYNNHSSEYLWIIIFLIVINGFTYWYFKPKKTYVVESTKEVILPIQNIEIENQNNSIDFKVLSIKNFIGKHYTNSDLSILDVQKGTGFNQRELNAIFKSEFQSTFNNYLNLIRITEVKRLLIQTNLSVSEIAYNCGYNQVPHFNRVFKKETGFSPKEFREKNSTNIPKEK